MKKTIALIMSLALTLSLLAGCADKKEPTGELNLFTWVDIFPQEVLDNFTKETGIKINYSSFDTDETMLAKLETAKGGDYDVVLADDYIIEVAIQEGLVKALDKEQLPNYKNINPAYQGLFYDPEDTYTVPYGAGVMTIVYDPAAAGVEIESFDDLRDPALKDSVGLVNSARVIHAMSLIADGQSLNTEDQDAIRKASERVMEMAPNVRFIKDDNLQDDIISGEISVGVMYTSQVTQACVAKPELKVVFPKEGVGFGTMAQFIPVNAPHPEAAHQFIDYILRPDVAKLCFEQVGYYSTNQAADALFDEQYKKLLTLPEDFEIDAMEAMHNVGADAMELHEKLWTEFRTACGQ